MFRSRTWQHVLDEIIKMKTGNTQLRWKTAAKDKAFVPLLSKPLIETQAEHFLCVLQKSAEYTHHVSVTPSHDTKLRNKLVFLALDLLYSKTPHSDVLMFLQDNGMTREEFMWFMKTSPAGF